MQLNCIILLNIRFSAINQNVPVLSLRFLLLSLTHCCYFVHFTRFLNLISLFRTRFTLSPFLISSYSVSVIPSPKRRYVSLRVDRQIFPFTLFSRLHISPFRTFFFLLVFNYVAYNFFYFLSLFHLLCSSFDPFLSLIVHLFYFYMSVSPCTIWL